MQVNIDRIQVNSGRREALPDAVRELADSISAVGLLNPITVDRDYILIAGLHRLEAAKLLGWAEIECNVSSLEGLQAELAEIDENFVRADLETLEFGKLLLRRKEIYEMLNPYVHFMLQNEIYVGSMVQGRQYTPSYRSKKREPIPKEDWVVVPDMHEPIISRELFDEAQKRLIARKKTIKAKDEPALFAGLFYCEACGTSMKLGVSQQKYFYYMCGRSQAIGTVACSSHYINRDTLYQVVQEDIQRNARLFSEDTEKAAQKLMELKCADQQKQTATMKRDLASAKKRLADLDMKLKRTYEDNMSGKLPDHIFTMFIADYDTERATLKANIAEMEKALEKVRDTKADIDRFADLIRKYTSFEKLDRFMLHELIDRITIYETPGMGRCRKGKEKRITIYYKFVGAIQ